MPGLLVVTSPGPDADTLCASLEERGFDVFSAGNGAAAVDVAFRRQPDVILLDSSLSAMDRWHAVKRLNTEPNTSRIPVLTLGSDASSPAGLQRVLAKIERTIGELPEAAKFQPRPASEPPSPVPSRPPASVMVDEQGLAYTPGYAPPRHISPRAHAARILVVDDNALNRDMLSRRLGRKGYEVEVAEVGEGALRLLENKPFDLVVLDWMMPGLSGIDVLKRIREQRSQVELPVIMATARTEAEDVVEALKAEANDYVTKPLNFDVVHARIRTQLGLVEAHRELKASERRFRALLENTGDMIVQYRLQGQVLYVSPASRTLLGYEPDELMRRSFYEWIHPIDRREIEAQSRRQPTLPPAYTFIARMQRRDQSTIWVETSARLLREGGQVIVQAACRDVTEHMERLIGDEPPLPLGGDIMAHPGWRGGASKPPAPERQGAPGAQHVLECRQGGPMVVVTVLGQSAGAEVADVVAEQVRRALGEQRNA